MIIVKSDEYNFVGYITDEDLWQFERKAALVGDTQKEVLMVRQAKYVDKANSFVIHCNSGGSKVLKPMKAKLAAV